MDKPKSKPTEKEKITQLPTMREKSDELDSLLSAEEESAYEKLKKQKMSDQGMVKTEELVDAAKKVYRKGKKAVGKMVEGAKKMISGNKEEDKK
jgi:SET domain-containing protein